MILVVGGTGMLGGRVVALLVQEGRSVRCLVRPGTDDAALRELGVEVVQGDLTEPTTLPAACAGVETVVTTATIIARRLAGGKQPSIDQVDQIGTAALIAVAEASGVQRFVYLSIAGVDQGPSSPMSRAKLANERRLRESTMRSVIVRPEAYQEIHLGPLGRFDMASGTVAVFGEGNNPLRWVAVDDVARLVAAVAVEDDPPALVEFGGPEPLSRNEAILVAEQVTGRRFKRLQLPRPVVKVGLRVLERPNDALATIFGLGLHMDVVKRSWSDAPLRDRGINPRSATEWLRQQAEATAVG